jgi:hypothetical protein
MRILDSDESRQLYGIIAVFSTRGKTALNNHHFHLRLFASGSMDMGATSTQWLLLR